MANEAIPASLLLSHWSKRPMSAVHSVDQRLDQGGYRSYYEKPRGLWVSVDGADDWQMWCEAANFDGLGTRYRVLLSDAANLLIMSDLAALRHFTRQYSRLAESPLEENPYARLRIDWQVVARQYHGIIIAPYQYECSLDDDTSWYYEWDCASGCIWNADAIATVATV